jgi:hypothetical protein
MGRKKKGANLLQEKLDKYLSEYELDELNEANDMQALLQMCRLELNMEKWSEALETIDPAADAKKVKDLATSVRDATASWVQLQIELGINRRKRQSESDETPLSYIERLKEQATKYINSRYDTLECSDCNLPLARFRIYVTDKGEEGSLASITKSIEVMKFSVEVECPRCRRMVEINERENKP